MDGGVHRASIGVFGRRIAGGAFKEHLGTVDVIDLGDGTCLGVYSTDALPDVMALVIGGATGDALENIKALAEHGHLASVAGDAEEETH